MAYKVFFKEDGPFTFVETLEEAAALMRLAPSTGPSKLPLSGAIPMDEVERVKFFYKDINRNARSFLLNLVDHPKGITGEKFSEIIAMPVEKFGGVLGGASKMAKKHKLNFRTFVESEMRTSGTQRFRWLCPGKLLLKYRSIFTGEESIKTASLGA
jgi:hypothetical protein